MEVDRQDTAEVDKRPDCYKNAQESWQLGGEQEFLAS